MSDTSDRTSLTAPSSLPITDRSQSRWSWLRNSIQLMKPVTWFAPTWAFMCGAIASGAVGWNESIGRLLLGMFMAGP
ncbi:MAG: bacteriochlorophyll synthase, partial [Chloroflexi bacterium]